MRATYYSYNSTLTGLSRIVVFSSEEDGWDGIPCSGLLFGGAKALPVIEVRQVGYSNRRCTEPAEMGRGREVQQGVAVACTLPAVETAKSG